MCKAIAFPYLCESREIGYRHAREFSALAYEYGLRVFKLLLKMSAIYEFILIKIENILYAPRPNTETYRKAVRSSHDVEVHTT